MQSNSILQAIFDYVKANLSHLPQSRIFCITFPYRNKIIPRNCYIQLEVLLKDDYSPELLLEIIHFTSYRMEKDEYVSQFIKHLWRYISNSKTKWILTDKILFTFAQLLIKLDQIDNTLRALKIATKISPNNPETWYQYIYALKIYTIDPATLLKTFILAFKQSNISIKLILLFIEYSLIQKNMDIIFDNYLTALENQNYTKEDKQSFVDSVLDLLLTKGKPDLIRQIYKHTFTYFPASCSFHLKCAHWEATAFNNIDISTIRNIYRSAVTRYGNTEPQLWLKFIDFESSIHEISKAGTLFWEAKKSLNPNLLQSFLVSHSSWLNSTTLLPEMIEQK